MKAFTTQELDAISKSLVSEYDVHVPVRRPDGTRTLGSPADGPLALEGGLVLKKVTNVFFPQMETVLVAGPDGIKTPAPLPKPIFVVGLTAQDADCLEFIDRFFATNFPDDLYARRRKNSVVVCVSGRCGRDGEFLKISGRRCDLELICDGERFLLAAYTHAGKTLAKKISGGVNAKDSALAALQKESDALPTDELELIRAASRLLLEDKVPDSFWRTISDRYLFVASSCGLCGTRSVKKLLYGAAPCGSSLKVDRDMLFAAVENLPSMQRVFKATGGAHAAAIFSADGEVLSFGEDVGRRTALDKAVGKAMLARRPTAGCAAALSGRVSFEMVLKAVRAGIELIAAVSAPSSLAVGAAARWNITLCGFVRNGRANIYTHPERENGSGIRL